MSERGCRDLPACRIGILLQLYWNGNSLYDRLPQSFEMNCSLAMHRYDKRRTHSTLSSDRNDRDRSFIAPRPTAERESGFLEIYVKLFPVRVTERRGMFPSDDP